MSASTSDSFEWWQVRPASHSVQFLASDDAQAESYSLGIVSNARAGGGVVSSLHQAIGAQSGASLTVSFWVKSKNAGDGAIVVEASPAGTTQGAVPVPGGTYDWQKVSTTITVPTGFTGLDFRIDVQGPTDGTWIDSMTVSKADGTGQSLINSGFETNSAELSVTNSSLILTQGRATIGLATRRSGSGWFHWSVTDPAGTVAASGDQLFAEKTGSVNLSALPVGYYTLAVDSTVAQAHVSDSVNFAIIAPQPKTLASLDSPFGVQLTVQDAEQPRLDNLMGSLAQTGVTHARVDLSWARIEQQPGVYTYPSDVQAAVDQLGDDGINPLLIAGYRNKLYDSGKTPSSPAGIAAYAAYANDLVTHFAADKPELDVYNEYDWFSNSACGKTAACYLPLLQATTSAVHADAPGVTIVSPGHSGFGFNLPWVSSFVAGGGLDSTDVVSAHPYTNSAPPESLISDLQDFDSTVGAAGGASKPVWLTEMGWATNSTAVTPAQQADYLVRMMAIGLAHGVERIYWYIATDLHPHADDLEATFGLFAGDSSFAPNTNAPKPSALAQAVMSQQLTGKKFASIDSTASGVYSYAFGADPTATRVMWATNAGATVNVATAGPITVIDEFGRSTSYTPTSGTVVLQLSGSPVYVSGPVSAVN